MLDQQYLRPETLKEALQLLDEYGKDARILAGGTDIIIGLRENAVNCRYLIDIKKIKEMKELYYSDKDGLSICGAVTLNELIASKYVQENYPILFSAGKSLANYLLRNRATMMGNICNASPAGDMLTPSLVLEGSIEAFSKDGSRIIPLKGFFLGVKKNVLKENEIAVRILIPSVKGKGQYLRRSRIKGHDLAQIGVSGFLKDNGGLRLALGSVAPVPVLIEDFCDIHRSDLKEEALRKKIIDTVMSRISPIGDQRASREYRTAMAGYLTGQVLETLAKEV